MPGLPQCLAGGGQGHVTDEHAVHRIGRMLESGTTAPDFTPPTRTATPSSSPTWAASASSSTSTPRRIRRVVEAVARQSRGLDDDVLAEVGPAVRRAHDVGLSGTPTPSGRPMLTSPANRRRSHAMGRSPRPIERSVGIRKRQGLRGKCGRQYSRDRSRGPRHSWPAPCWPSRRSADESSSHLSPKDRYRLQRRGGRPCRCTSSASPRGRICVAALTNLVHIALRCRDG